MNQLAPALVHEIFRHNCVNYPGNYEVTPGQALQIAKKLLSIIQTSEPVAEIIECQIMGGQTVREIDGRWKFLKIGDKLYTKESN